MGFLEAETADWTKVLAAEEVHQLVVAGADALHKVTDRLAQLMGAKYRVFPVRPQVLITVRGHAGEASMGRFSFHTRITAYDILFLDYVLLYKLTGFALFSSDFEGLHNSAEDRVFLQLRSGGKEGPTLRTAVSEAGVLPGGEQTVLAEVVSAGDGHRTLEGVQTNATGQLFLQTYQRERRLFHSSHGVTYTDGCEAKMKLKVSCMKTKVKTNHSILFEMESVTSRVSSSLSCLFLIIHR